MVDRLAEALAVREIIFGVMMTGATVKYRGACSEYEGHIRSNG